MMYKVTAEITESELKKMYNYTKIIVLYKDAPDDLDVEFVQNNFVDGIWCDAFYDMYCEHFMDEHILPKKKFYDLVRNLTETRCKIVRISEGFVKNCFVKKVEKI